MAAQPTTAPANQPDIIDNNANTDNPNNNTVNKLNQATKADDNASPPKKDFKHSKKDFELGQLLGSGAFAKVVEGTIINDKSPQFGNKYAVKVMDKRHIVKNNKIKYVTIEKKVFLATEPHPFICHLHFTFQDSYSLFMVLDLCQDAELSYQIWKYGGLTEEITVFYISEIISCLEFMHSKGIYHRDIKPENVLLHDDGHIRLTDFGTAKIVDKNDTNTATTAANTATTATATATASTATTSTDDNKNNQTDKPNDVKQRKGSFVGTAQYVPPELLDKHSLISYEGMDFWALGILIYQCLVNETPFNAPNEYLTFKKIEEHDYTIPDNISNNAKDIINKFLTQDYTKRLGMNGYDDIKTHLFFQSVTSWEWDDMKNVVAPTYPQTPKNSPANDENKKKELRGSVYADDLSATDPVTPLDINNNNNQNDDNKNNNGQRQSTQELNDKLYANWNRFLNDKETIVMGSSVEQSKLFGFGSVKSVMIFTSMRRILLIDNVKMKIRKNGDIPRSSIVSCKIIDKETFELVRVKKNLKFKCTGSTAEKWKKAFDKLC